MNIPEKISSKDFPEIWSFISEKDRKASTIEKWSSFIAKIGHIAFHIGLVTLSILFSYVMVKIDDKLTMRGWFRGCYDNLFALFPAEIDPTIYILGAPVVALLLVPFISSAIASVCCIFIKVRCYPFQPPTGTPVDRNVSLMLKQIKEIEQKSRQKNWDDFYPMNAHEFDGLFDINLYNFIPWLCMWVPLSLFVFLGTRTNSPEVYLGAVFLSMLFAFFALLIVVPVWKLSSIINSLFYRSQESVYFGGLEKKLKTFVEEQKQEEEERAERIRRQKEEQERQEQERKRLDDLNKAELLYAKATEGEQIDEELLREAAYLGLSAACKEYGKILYMESLSSMLTKSEKESRCKYAAGFLKVAKDEDVEAEFLWLACDIMYGSHDSDGWYSHLKRARVIKASGQLPEIYSDTIDTMIETLVRTVDQAKENEANEERRQAQRRFRSYCRYYNAGICNHMSDSLHISKCTDPVGQKCLWALQNHAVVYEEY